MYQKLWDYLFFKHNNHQIHSFYKNVIINLYKLYVILIKNIHSF